MELFVFLTIFVLLAFYVAHGLRFVYTRKWLRVLLGPGMLAANVARLLACQATFTPRTQTNLWERDGVKYDKCPLPWLGATVIATATFVLPFALLFGVNHVMDYPLLFQEEELPQLHLAASSFRGFLDMLLDLDNQALHVYDQIIGAIHAAGATNPAPWVVLYLSVVVMLATAPTKRDLRWLLLGLLVMVVANRLFGLVGDSGVGVLSREWFESEPVLLRIWYLCTFLVSVLFGLFLIVICIDIVKKVREVAIEPEITTSTDLGSRRSSSRSRSRT